LKNILLKIIILKYKHTLGVALKIIRNKKNVFLDVVKIMENVQMAYVVVIKDIVVLLLNSVLLP